VLVIRENLSGEYDGLFILERARVTMLLPRVRRLSLLLAASAALLPLCYAHAGTTEISDDETTPVTSNGNDVTVDSGASITVGTNASAAITVNSPNAIDNEGSITANDGTNQSGIKVTVGGTESILNDGAITVTDSTLATTIPLTQGQNRYGILINTAAGAPVFTGNITNSDTGSITVRGNHSAGIDIATGGLKGSIVNSGTIGITGNNSFGIVVAEGAQVYGPGNIQVSNVIDSLGQGSGGVLLNGRIGGQLAISSTIRSDGYFSGAVITDRPTDGGQSLTPQNLYQASSAVTVNRDVGKGILIGSTGFLVTYGSAAALAITPTHGTAVIGPTSTSTTSANAADLVIGGVVRGNGVFDGVDSTGIRIGGAGGIAKLADGITINAGAKVDATAYAGKNAVTGVNGGNATAISLGSGADVSTLNNAGAITATVNAGLDATISGRAAAIVVDGGALGAINNTGQITATSAKGQAVAMDLRGDTKFVTVTQSSSNNAAAPSSITGNILFGANGADLELDSGTIAGNVAFGNSDNNVLTINNGGVLGGNITQAAGGHVAVNVQNGRLASTSTGSLAVSQLTIGKKGEIDFAVDPSTLKNGSLSVAGNIIFAQGAKIGLTLDTQLLTPETFTVIDGTSSSGLGNQAQLILGNVPYFYNATIITNPGTGTVSVGLSDRPFSQAGVLGSESAYNAVFKDSYLDTGIRDSFNAAGNHEAFKALFAQMLPSYSGGLFEVLSQGADALARTQAANPVTMRGDRSGGWAEQFGFGAVDSTSSSPGYHGGGLGFAFGWENPITVTSAWGVSVAYMRAAVDDFNTGPGNEQVGTTYTVGAYYREADGRLHYDASINGGVAEMNGVRNFSGVDLTGQEIDRSASASWLGGLLQAHLGVSYEEQLGDEFYVRPMLSGDYFLLSQGSYKEHNGGTAFDLAVNGQTDSQGSVTGGIAFGMQFGDRDFMWKPEVMVGYRQVFGGPDSVTAAFAGGSAFTLNSASQKGGAVARIGIHGGNKFSDIAIEAGGEDRDNYRAFDGRIVARFRF